jgi:adenine specific DNA methylase Mod
MGKIEVTKTELVWPRKYNEDGTRREVERVSLPFQIIETINESRATREAKKKPQTSLFDVWEGKEGQTFEEGWKNKLIWGDNLLVMGSLLEKLAGKVDLIYIDPPFATGVDFSFITQIGGEDLAVTKEESIIEEKAYRDTWGMGVQSYLSMLLDRLSLMHELLSERGTLFVHVGWQVSSAVRLIMDEILGADRFLNEIIWKRTPHAGSSKARSSRFPVNHESLYWYAKGQKYTYHNQYIAYEPDYVARFTNPDGDPRGAWQSVALKTYSEETFQRLKAENKLIPPQRKGAGWRYKWFLSETKGKQVEDIWDDVGALNSMAEERTDYSTQKPESLLQRIIGAASDENGLVADFFCGSGTTLAAAEKLGRRWIGCDLSRWAIHVTRKRLLGVEGCKSFEVLNLGKYERKYWQGVTFGGKKDDHPFDYAQGRQLAIFQYLAFILKLYGAEPLAGMQHLHGKKGRAVIHIGAVDAPVTIDEINACIEECLAVKQFELHVLGWEWEMGLANLMVQEAKKRGVKLLLLNIPREVMEQQAVEKGDIKFFEVAHLEVEIKQEKGRKVAVALKDFAFPYADLIPDEVRAKIKKWSDYVDYWAVDWNFQNDTFMQGWVAYRTRKDRTLALKTDVFAYDKAGKYTVMVKVIDIFGNDTSQAFDLEVR